MLLRLIRGTGIHGLAAMEYMRKDGLIRPLLDVPRKDIEEYCRGKGLRTLTDKTNLSEEYLRNRVRLSVLPMLEEINPSVKQGLIRLAANASMDDGYLSELAENWYRGHVKRSGEGPVLFVKDLKGLQDALFYRAVRLAFAEAGLEKDIEAVHIKALKRSVYAGIGNKTDMPHTSITGKWYSKDAPARTEKQGKDNRGEQGIHSGRAEDAQGTLAFPFF